MTDAHVTRVFITNSQISFVIRTIFTTFVNLREYHFTNSNVPTRIQPNAFQFASSLHQITFSFTLLHTINPNAFQGANNLLRLELNNNQITALPAGALNGLSSLTHADFSANAITTIHDQFTRPVSQLQTLIINSNQIQRLPNTLLITNPNLIVLSATNNQIYQIGRSFLDNLRALTTLNLSANTCISQNWSNIGGVGGPTKDGIRASLTTCFNNYVSGPVEMRDFGLQLRGSMILYDEEGNLIGRL